MKPYKRRVERVWMERHGSVMHLITSFQCHKLASALPGVSLHCVVSLLFLLLSQP